MQTLKDEILGRAEALEKRAEAHRNTAAEQRKYADEEDANAVAKEQRAKEYRTLAEKA